MAVVCKVLALITLAPEILPAPPVVTILPTTVTTPLIESLLTVTIFASPLLEMFTLPAEEGILTLLFPLLIDDTEVVTVAQVKLPKPSVCKYCRLLPPVIFTLAFEPRLTLPELVKLTFPLAVNAVVEILPADKLPDTFAVPVILAPVELTTIVLVPAAVNVMFALEVIAMFEVPLANLPTKLAALILAVEFT